MFLGQISGRGEIPSLVMNEMNSLTHSCMHSLASLAIFAFSGNAIFMIRATGAKFRMLASDAKLVFAPCDLCCGGEDEDSGEADDMILRCKATVFSGTVDQTGVRGRLVIR